MEKLFERYVHFCSIVKICPFEHFILLFGELSLMLAFNIYPTSHDMTNMTV